MATITDRDREQMRQAVPEIDLIADADLRAQVTEALTILWRESDWDDLYALPYLTEVPDVSWVQHTRFVAAGSLKLADLYAEFSGRQVNRDLVLAAALLHDGSKFQEYAKDQGGREKSEMGHKLQHSLYAAHVALNVGLPLDVVHLIVSHTPMAFVKPSLAEGWIVRGVDAVMVEALMNKGIEQYVAGSYGKHG